MDRTSTNDTTQDTVRGSDGTAIAVTTTGAGTPVVVLHGSIDTGSSWRPVADLLGDRARVVLVDRRGHGASGPAGRHSLQAEVADALAVLDTLDRPAVLVGHSFGGVVALHVALAARPDGLAGLALYEPPLPLSGPAAGPDLTTYRELLDAGRPGDALAFGMTRIAEQPTAQVEALRSTPLWAGMEALAPSWVPELEALDALPRSADAYRAITAPTLLLLGDQSADDPFGLAVRSLAGTLPDAEAVVLPGQGHVAHWSAPALLAEHLGRFVDARR